MSEQPQQSQNRSSIKGIVKQVLSGDTIIIRGNPRGGPPPEKTVTLSYITAPKLAKRIQQVTDDEPFAWEAREFLRKRLIGQNVYCSIEKSLNKDYATVYHGPDPNTGENINELLVKEGLVSVRGDNVRQPSPELQRLKDLEEQAKKERKGKWDDSVNPEDHKRKIKWTVDNMMAFIDKMEHKPIKAIIEHVRDGSTVRGFLMIPPDYVYVTLMMSGIRSPQFKLDSSGKVDSTRNDEFADQAKFFTESRLLQQDVEIKLESYSGPNFIGSILHPKGSIAEELLKAGFARFVDWSIAKMPKSDQDKLRLAEKIAKEKKLKLWKDWKPPPPISDKEFVGTVMEVINGDALMVKMPNGVIKKIFLASVRPPRLSEGQENRPPAGKVSRQLYDVPWMFEAREFLRKKLIGKKVNVSVDYIQPARDSMAEKCCCTVTISNQNVAETLVSKGLATVVKYRQNDDQRASAYDSLFAAELKAIKGQKGLHAKKDIPTHRVNDYSGEQAKAKGLLPHLQRLPRVEALVEYVASGSRMRIFIPKESSLVTFLLSGIDIKAEREDGLSNEEAAAQFTKEKVLQREVEIKVENCDRAGNFIGWLWCEGMNLSVALVEHGLAKVHISGENSEYSKLFMNAKNIAKSNGLWKFSEVEEHTDVVDEDKTPDRKMDQKEVMVVVTSGINFYCQFSSEEAKLSALQEKLNLQMAANPPLSGVYTPKKGDMCAAKYSADNCWYRAKIEKIAGNKVSVHYVDYGNKADVAPSDCAQLPSSVDHKDERPYARYYTLICVQPSNDLDFLEELNSQMFAEVSSKKFLLNEELNQAGIAYATLVDPETKEDLSKKLITEGLLLVEKRRERKFQKLLAEYQEAEEEAKKKRLNIWEYGDVREDDDKEFGMGR